LPRPKLWASFCVAGPKTKNTAEILPQNFEDKAHDKGLEPEEERLVSLSGKHIWLSGWKKWPGAAAQWPAVLFFFFFFSFFLFFFFFGSSGD
jgi:hypothetical protein